MVAVVFFDHGDARAAELSYGEQIKAVGHQIGNHGVAQGVCGDCIG